MLSLWNVNDAATAVLMRRFYQGPARPPGRPGPTHAQSRSPGGGEAVASIAEPRRGGSALRQHAGGGADRQGHRPPRSAAKAGRPYEHPYYWAAFILIGDPSAQSDCPINQLRK